VQAALDITVLRSGIPDTMPGRSVNLCERGIAAVLAGELLPGESVGVEVRLPMIAESLRAKATVRYQDKLRCGLEFIGLSAEQRASIRDWAKGTKAEAEVSVVPAAVVSAPVPSAPTTPAQGMPAPVMEKRGSEPVRERGAEPLAGSSRSKPKKSPRGTGWIIFLLVAAIAVAVFWWRWNKAWEELESGLKNPEAASAEKPQAQVPAEVMEKLIIHRVEPTYPAEARQGKLEGTIALDIVVGRDGSVVSMHALNGPEVLARAAMDALRWWKFEPYRVNGEPATVETTVAVEFKR
jgi:protein TonB